MLKPTRIILALTTLLAIAVVAQASTAAASLGQCADYKKATNVYVNQNSDCAVADYVIKAWPRGCDDEGTCSLPVDLTNINMTETFDCKAKAPHGTFHVKCKGRGSQVIKFDYPSR